MQMSPTLPEYEYGEYDVDMNMISKIHIHIVLWPALQAVPLLLVADILARCFGHCLKLGKTVFK
jgi:hypothetical protein